MANENTWNFTNYTGAPNTPDRPYQPYTATPPTAFDYPRAPLAMQQPVTPRPYYQQQHLPLHPAHTPLTDPLQQTLPMVPSTAANATPHRGTLDMFQPGYYDDFECELREGDTVDVREAASVTEARRAVADHAGQRVANDGDLRRVASAGHGAKGKRDTSAKGKRDTSTKGGEGDASMKDGEGNGDGKEKKKGSKKGKGSKSGEANRRAPGVSDEEIEVLDEKESKAAAIVATANAWNDTERLKMLKYICSDEIWPNFKVKQGEVYIHVSKTCLSDI